MGPISSSSRGDTVATLSTTVLADTSGRKMEPEPKLP